MAILTRFPLLFLADSKVTLQKDSPVAPKRLQEKPKKAKRKQVEEEEEEEEEDAEA